MTIRFGKVELTFLSLLVVYFLLGLVRTPFTLQLLIVSALFVTGAWTFVRLARTSVRHLLWRLRNRLIVAYIFIALVPVVLITLLAGIGGFLIGGQFTVWLVTSELERRTGTLKTSLDFLARGAPGQNAPTLPLGYPGLQFIESPPEAWKPGSGLMVRDGVLYGWAYGASASRRMMATFPITREY